MKKYLSVLFLVVFLVPSIALASWWNPFTWKIFKKRTPIPQVQVINTEEEKIAELQKQLDELKNKNKPIEPAKENSTDKKVEVKKTTPVVSSKNTEQTNKISEQAKAEAELKAKFAEQDALINKQRAEEKARLEIKNNTEKALLESKNAIEAELTSLFNKRKQEYEKYVAEYQQAKSEVDLIEEQEAKPIRDKIINDDCAHVFFGQPGANCRSLYAELGVVQTKMLNIWNSFNITHGITVATPTPNTKYKDTLSNSGQATFYFDVGTGIGNLYSSDGHNSQIYCSPSGICTISSY